LSDGSHSKKAAGFGSWIYPHGNAKRQPRGTRRGGLGGIILGWIPGAQTAETIQSKVNQGGGQRWHLDRGGCPVLYDKNKMDTTHTYLCLTSSAAEYIKNGNSPRYFVGALLYAKRGGKTKKKAPAVYNRPFFFFFWGGKTLSVVRQPARGGRGYCSDRQNGPRMLIVNVSERASTMPPSNS